MGVKDSDLTQNRANMTVQRRRKKERLEEEFDPRNECLRAYTDLCVNMRVPCRNHLRVSAHPRYLAYTYDCPCYSLITLSQNWTPLCVYDMSVCIGECIEGLIGAEKRTCRFVILRFRVHVFVFSCA